MTNKITHTTEWCFDWNKLLSVWLCKTFEKELRVVLSEKRAKDFECPYKEECLEAFYTLTLK